LTLYAESSAVLAWLLGQPSGEAVASALAGASAVVTSDLTLIECDRVLRRLAVGGAGSAQALAVEALRARLALVVETWAVEPIAPRVVARARQGFPDDAIRTLDAIHLATAVCLGEVLVDLEVASLDDCVRLNALALGFRVLPA
jgi:predicted nucleic acid-binding protein